VGFAPMKDPLISVAVIAEHGCHGGSTAAPVARAVIKTYLEKYYPDLYSEKAVIARLKASGQPLNFPVPAQPVRVVPNHEDDEDVVGNADNPVLPQSNTPPPPAPLPLPDNGKIHPTTPSRDVPGELTGDADE
jgi:hypothetical protein